MSLGRGGCFYGTKHDLPDGWDFYGTPDYWRQEYWCQIQFTGRRSFHLHAIVKDGKVSFKTRYRTNFPTDYVGEALNKASEFCKEYWKAKYSGKADSFLY